MRSHLLIVWITAFAISVNAQPVKKDSTLQQGLHRIETGDYPGAIREFNKILRADPNSIEALRGRAEAKFQMGDSGTAIQDAEKACMINPKYADAWFIRAEILYSQGKYSGAVAAYKNVLELKPGDAESFRGVVFCTFFSGAEKDAFAMVDKAISKDSKTGINYYIRGVLYNNKGKYSKAIDDFDKALNFDPGKNEFNILLNRGVCFLNLEEPDPAETDLTKAIGIKPDNASAWHSRGRVYYFLKQYDKAVSDFNESLELNPNSDVTLYNLAMAYFRAEDNKNACEYFHKSCSMGNKNACKMVLMNCAEIKK